MRAVSFNVTVPSYLVGKGLGGLTESAIFGGLSGVRFVDVSEPALPGDDWVRLDILKAGISGTDIGTLTSYLRNGKAPLGVDIWGFSEVEPGRLATSSVPSTATAASG